jgi:multidrug resistance efflux pump
MISRPIIYLLLAGALIGGAAQYRAHVFGLGVGQEAARRDAIDAENDRRARAALADANARVLVAQANLDGAMAGLSKLQTELSYEQATSAALQSDLAAGRRRLSVLTRARAPGPTEQGAGAAAAAVDPGLGVAADLDGRAAADLEWMRQTRDDAIAGLQACIASYGAVKVASDSLVP